MRFARIGILGAMIFAAAACQTDDGGASTPIVPPLAFVRYINAQPDSISMDSIFVRVNPVSTLPETTFYSTTHSTTLRFIDQIDFTPQTFVGVAFRGLGQGNYQGLEAGSRQFRIFTFDPRFFSTNLLADTTFSFTAGSYYTIVYSRDATAAQDVAIFTDDVPVSNAQVQYRATHVATGAAAVDLYATVLANDPIAGAPAAANVAFRGQTAWLSRASGGLAAQVTATGQTTSLAGAVAPVGTTGTPTADPVAGSGVAGSVLSAYYFSAAPAVTFYGRSFRAAGTPGIVWYPSRQPIRTTP